MKARKRGIGNFVVWSVALCCAAVVAESRILHLPGGFVQPYGSYTTGGEFPGAIRVAEFAPEAGKKDGAVLVLWSVEGACEWELPVVSGRKLRLTECPIYLKF